MNWARGLFLRRREGLLGQIGIKVADPGGFRDEILVGGFGEVRLELDRFVDVLHADQLFEVRAAFLEGLLRIVRHFGRDGLQTLGRRGGRLDNRLERVRAGHRYPWEVGRHKTPSGSGQVDDPRPVTTNY
jgi:hypothetical protein